MSRVYTAAMSDVETTLTRLKELGRLPSVLHWTIDRGRDSTGDPAIWVWIVVDDNKFDRETVGQLRETIREALHELPETTEWTYVRLLPASEADHG